MSVVNTLAVTTTARLLHGSSGHPRETVTVLGDDSVKDNGDKLGECEEGKDATGGPHE
jgi:hypothetical protein